MNTQDTPLPAIVDELAEVRTQLAVLESREKQLKAILEATGLKEVCGTNLRAVISTCGESVIYDYKAIVTSLNLSDAELAPYGKVKKGFSTVRLNGYN